MSGFAVIDANGNFKTNQLSTPISLAKGGTAADLSGTGGTSKVLEQLSVGAAITVAQLAALDLSDYATGTWTPTLNGFTIVGALTVAGQYIKIGKLVFLSCQFHAATSIISASGGASYVTNFPYVPANHVPVIVVNYSSAVGYGNGVMDSGGIYFPPFSTGTSEIDMSVVHMV